MTRPEIHDHAIRLGYSVHKESDGTYTLLGDGELVSRRHASRDAAWERAYGLAREGKSAARVAYELDRNASRS